MAQSLADDFELGLEIGAKLERSRKLELNEEGVLVDSFCSNHE